MPDKIAECEQVAQVEGLAAGLAAAFTGLADVTPPGRVAAVPTIALPVTGMTPGEPVIAHDMASQEGISFVVVDRAPSHGRLTEFCARLAAVRLGVTRRLLEWAVECLSGRTAGGEPTIRKQLVLGVLADAQTGIEVARRSLQVAGSVPAAVVEVHDQLTALDWEATKLLGGSGYVAGTPARGAYVSRLVANCWIPREGVS